VCTVVVRWSGSAPVELLALRDELVGRDFDDPAEHWPDLPGVVGGRDRVAGGTWCATHVPTGTTALVLNRPERREAAAGAPSRGVLPLLAAVHGDGWVDRVALDGMASFALVLAAPDRLRLWVFDGERLVVDDLAAGTHVVTSGRAEEGKAERYLDAFRAAPFPDGWRAQVTAAPPRPDATALVVRVEEGDRAFATVFGQLMVVGPRRLELQHSRTPWVDGSWQAVLLPPPALP
jgi:hypothetical protein